MGELGINLPGLITQLISFSILLMWPCNFFGSRKSLSTKLNFSLNSFMKESFGVGKDIGHSLAFI